MTNLYKKIGISIASGLVGLAVLQPVNAAGDISKVEQRVQQLVGADAGQAKISETKIPGLYQVQLGLTVVYMSADGNYLMNGNMIDLANDKNLTRSVQAETRKSMLSKIPESSMILYPAKDEKHTITVFTDIDCPYCKKLHKEIPALNKAGVTVRYIGYPRAGLNSPSYNKAVSIWCSADRAKMMDDAMKGMSPEAKSCENPVRNHMMQAQIFGVNGTPNIIFDNGNMVPGYAPAQEIIKMLKES